MIVLKTVSDGQEVIMLLLYKGKTLIAQYRYFNLVWLIAVLVQISSISSQWLRISRFCFNYVQYILLSGGHLLKLICQISRQHEYVNKLSPNPKLYKDGVKHNKVLSLKNSKSAHHEAKWFWSTDTEIFRLWDCLYCCLIWSAVCYSFLGFQVCVPQGSDSLGLIQQGTHSPFVLLHWLDAGQVNNLKSI